MTDEERFFYNHGYKQAERDFIKELEKIKAEIGNKFVDIQDGSEEWLSVWNNAIFECLEILDKHISELKGEKQCD